jgi:hypothetical protein
MNISDRVGIQIHGRMTVPMGKPLITVPEPEHRTDSVMVGKAQDNGPGDIVKSRTEAAASDDAAPQFRRIEVNPFPGACHFKGGQGFLRIENRRYFVQVAVIQNPVRITDKLTCFHGRLDSTCPQPLNG